MKKINDDDDFEVHAQGLTEAFMYCPWPCQCGDIKSGVSFDIRGYGSWAVPVSELEEMLDKAYIVRKLPTTKERIAALQEELAQVKVELEALELELEKMQHSEPNCVVVSDLQCQIAELLSESEHATQRANRAELELVNVKEERDRYESLCWKHELVP